MLNMKAVSGEELGDREADDTDSDGREPSSKRSKTTKFSGAFQYKTKFNKIWQNEWPFVSPVPGNQHSFMCTICSKTLSCGHQGAADIRDHISTQSHQKLAKSIDKSLYAI